MLEYNLPRGNIEIKDAIPLIVEALCSSKDCKKVTRKVMQGIRDGRKSKKNRLPKGLVLLDKVFWEWAIIKWPRLKERIEGIPLYVNLTGYMDGAYAIDVYDTDNPLELNILVESFLSKRISFDQRTEEDLTDLKRAYVMAEYEVNKCRNEKKRLQAENGSLKKAVEGRQQTEEDRKKRSGHRGG